MLNTTIFFYTLPPREVQWDYLLVNPNNYRELYRRSFKHAILDCGVQFLNRQFGRLEYSQSFLLHWKFLAQQLTTIFKDKIWITIPDYPDDYLRRVPNNVEKSIALIEDFIQTKDANWLPVIQSKYMDLESFNDSCLRLRQILKDYDRIAIGSVCKARNVRYIEETCKIARQHFPDYHIHAFGLTLSALPRVKHLIDSWDSLAYTFPRQPSKPSCRNKKERIAYFHAYIARVNKILSS